MRSRRSQESSSSQEQSWTRREPQPCHWDKFPSDSHFVYGCAPVTAALRSRRRELHALYYEGGALSSELSQMCETVGIEAVEVAKGRLQSLINQPKPVHQGLALCCAELLQEKLNAAFDAPLWLALDQVQDPRNLGAIARSARFFDVPVVTCAKNSAPLSPVASKASAGAIEEMEIYESRNLMNFLRNSKPHFRVVGAALSGGEKRKDRQVISLRDFRITQPTILVLGSEGVGLRTNIIDACDDLVKVKGRLDPLASQLDSLNVAVTAALLLHHLDLQIERLEDK